MTVKVLIADDHVMFREGLRSLLQKEADIEVVAEAGDGRAAEQLAGKLRPDVVVMDLNMPALNGIEATRRIADQFPSVRVLALSMESRRQYVVQSLRAGAAGYLVKDAAVGELVTAIRTVAAGEPYLTQRVSNMLLKEFMRRAPAPEASGYEMLTEREREILQLVADGKNSKEIALVLKVSQKTVDNHKNSIMKKLDLYSIAALTKFAIREGLSSLE